MVEWRWWRARGSAAEYGPDPQGPSVDEAASEGVAMAEQAAVMALKNRVLVSAHTEPDGFEPEEFLPAAEQILQGLARESREAAERTRMDRRNASTLRGRSIHQHDYRRGDVENLILREESFDEVAQRLELYATDQSRLLMLIERARAQAWGELAREMERLLDRAETLEFGDENYAAEREARLNDFIVIDLLNLRREAERPSADAADQPN